MRIATYSRCSTSKQDLESQQHALQEWTERKKSELAGKDSIEVLSYGDDAVTGWIPDRGGITQLLADAKEKKFDFVAVVELSRIGRSMPFISNTVQQLADLGILLVLVNSGTTLDYKTLEGRALVNALALGADVEGMLIKERNARARLKIKRDGIKVGRKLAPVSAAAIMALRREGRSVREIAKEMGVSVATAFRRLKTGHISGVAELAGKRKEPVAIPAGKETALQ